MIGQFPLWMVLIIWFLQRRTTNTIHPLEYAKAANSLDMIRRSLPIPRNKFEQRLITSVLLRIDKEHRALYDLQKMNVTHIGIFEK